MDGSGVDIGNAKRLTVLVESEQSGIIFVRSMRISCCDVIDCRLVPLLKFVLTAAFSVDRPN